VNAPVRMVSSLFIEASAYPRRHKTLGIAWHGTALVPLDDITVSQRFSPVADPGDLQLPWIFVGLSWTFALAVVLALAGGAVWLVWTGAQSTEGLAVSLLSAACS